MTIMSLWYGTGEKEKSLPPPGKKLYASWRHLNLVSGNILKNLVYTSLALNLTK